MKRYQQLLVPHRENRPTAYWIYGATYLDREAYVSSKHPTEETYAKSTPSHQWRGYENQKVVIINNPTKASIFSTVMQVADMYPMQVEVPYSYRKFNSPFVYITSPHPPEYFCQSDNDLHRIIRRMDAVIHLKESGRAETRTDYPHSYFDPVLVKPVTATDPILEKMFQHCQTKMAAKALSRLERKRPIEDEDAVS